MKLLPLDKLGARETSAGKIQIGVFLPWVSPIGGYEVMVKIIHEEDQFLKAIQPRSFPLVHSTDATYGDYWSSEVNIPGSGPAAPGSSWGQPGTYVYRYEIRASGAGILDWIVDPFAREFGVGKLSAFTLGYIEHSWSAQESAWRVPNQEDLIFYELQLDEFGQGLPGTIAKLDYLADLGVNCLEIMPVSNVSMTVDWGFLPIGYFGVDERFGNRNDFQRLVDAAHQRGLAVIVDAVYGHTAGDFPYSDLYRRLNFVENPFLGAFANNYFGESTDFARQFTRDFFYSVNYLWLDRFHVDGFRYDCVPNYWDGPAGSGYASLVYHTYQLIKSNTTSGDYWSRFENGARINLIQCAEQLEDPVGVLYTSYTNSTWQNGTLDAARSVAKGDNGALYKLGLRLGLDGYPVSVDVNGDTIEKTALQYIETHDHERFVCNFGVHAGDNPLFQEGDRGRWYKVQPYLIGVLTAKGIPLIWQGQEFAENYWLPNEGMGRVMLLRPVRWDYFYDEIGRAAVSLVRRLTQIRHTLPELRRGDYYFYNDWSLYQSKAVLVFSRRIQNQCTVVALNFGDVEQVVPFWFPVAGAYTEKLHGRAEDEYNGVQVNSRADLVVPSNYGRVWANT